MKKLLVIASVLLAGLVSVTLVQGQAPSAAKGKAVKAAPTEAAKFINQYCIGCHSQAAKNATNPVIKEAARHLTLDNLDIDHVDKHPEEWEKVVRKVRAGMMPPAGMPRPDERTRNTFVTFLEGALDRAAAAAPNPGRKEALHRLNRTEYRNAVREPQNDATRDESERCISQR